MPYIILVKHYLDQIDPKLWYLVILLLVGLGMEIWRTKAPASFAKVPPKLKVLPPTLVGLVLSASASDNIKDVVWNAVIGTLLGLTAVGGYEAKVRLLSGQGSRDPKPSTKAEPKPEPTDVPKEPDAAKDKGDEDP